MVGAKIETLQAETQSRGMGDRLRLIRLYVVARGEVNDSGGGPLCTGLQSRAAQCKDRIRTWTQSADSVGRL